MPAAGRPERSIFTSAFVLQIACHTVLCILVLSLRCSSEVCSRCIRSRMGTDCRNLNGIVRHGCIEGGECFDYIIFDLEWMFGF